jgi:microcystin-dependent protein
MPAHSHGGATNTSSAVSGTSGVAGGHTHTGTTDSQGNHRHNVSVAMWTVEGINISVNGRTGRAGYATEPIQYAGNHYHNLNINPVGDHSHTFTVPAHTHGINSEGSSSAHNVVQPYMAINYIIKF